MARFATVLLVTAACAHTSADTARVRPLQWAQPVIGSAIDNWYCVSPELFRCAQPSAANMRELAAFGVKSVVNLRQYHTDTDEVEGTSLRVHDVRMSAGTVTYPELVVALAAVVAAEKPVVVHCWQGADRTGAVVAAWRIAVDGWSPKQALEEMVGGGFGHSLLYGNLRQLVVGLDGTKLRHDVGMPSK